MTCRGSLLLPPGNQRRRLCTYTHTRTPCSVLAEDVATADSSLSPQMPLVSLPGGEGLEPSPHQDCLLREGVMRPLVTALDSLEGEELVLPVNLASRLVLSATAFAQQYIQVRRRRNRRPAGCHGNGGSACGAIGRGRLLRAAGPVCTA